MSIFTEWLVVLPLAIPLVAAGLCVAAWGQVAVHRAIAALALGVLGLSSGALMVVVWAEGPVTMTMGNWAPPFGITFVADTLSAGLVCAAAVIGLVILFHAAETVDEGAKKRGFYPLLLALMAGVCGAFLTGDIFNLYVWFEVILIASIGLLIIGRTFEQIDGAVKYTTLSLVATTIFLVTTGMLYGVAGTLNMADLAIALSDRRDEPIVIGIAVLYVMAFGMKAAAFPLFFWLPASYHTAQPAVSAFFAALLTKVGVYVLIRVFTLIFPATAGVDTLFLWIAVTTMVVGAIGALAQSDLRRLVAFLVVAGIGYMLLGLALGPAAMTGSVLYILHSMVVTAALFLGVGIARDMAGQSWLRGRGLYRAAPVFSALVLASAFSMAGSPPFGGLWPKILLVEAGLEAGSSLAVGAVLLSGFLTLVALGRAFALAFWADDDEAESDTQAPALATPRFAAMAPFALLVGLTALMGLYPAPFVTFAQRAADQVTDTSVYIAAVAADGPTLRGEAPPAIPGKKDKASDYGRAAKGAAGKSSSEIGSSQTGASAKDAAATQASKKDGGLWPGLDDAAPGDGGVSAPDQPQRELDL